MARPRTAWRRFSALQRAEIAEMMHYVVATLYVLFVSVLFNEPKLLKCTPSSTYNLTAGVSVLFNEPKLLKCCRSGRSRRRSCSVSVLFNEPKLLKSVRSRPSCSMGRSFSALQRAEIAEMSGNRRTTTPDAPYVSVLFNEPKLLKCNERQRTRWFGSVFQCSSTSRNC